MVPRDRKDSIESQEHLASQISGENRKSYSEHSEPIISLLKSKLEGNSFFLIYILFLALLGLHCCARAFSSCGERGLLFVAVHGLLIAVASLVVEHGLQGTRASVVVARGLSSCGSQALELRLSSCDAQAQLLRGMWDLPRPGLEPVSPALAGGFLTTVPPGNSGNSFFIKKIYHIP